MSEAVIERPSAPSLVSRAIGVITAPRETFEKIVAAPRVLGALALVALIGALTVGGFLMTDVGQQAWIDQAVSGQEAWGVEVTDEAYANIQKMAPMAPYLGGVPYLFMIPIGTAITAGILFAIFNAIMGGTATFKQVMAVAAHSQIIMALALIVSMPINYMKGAMTGATSLSVLFPMLDESSFAARFLGMIDLFIVWYVIVLSIGLAVLYRRKTKSVAMVLFGIYAVIAIGVALFQSSRGGA
jgi:hypothetical protein